MCRLWSGPVPPLWSYEWPTLSLLEQHCHRSEGAVLYLHTKGASREQQHEAVTAWRHLMEEFAVWRWPACLAAVTDANFSTCGVQYESRYNPSYAGNVW